MNASIRIAAGMLGIFIASSLCLAQPYSAQLPVGSSTTDSFNGGVSLPAGKYEIRYLTGCVQWPAYPAYYSVQYPGSGNPTYGIFVYYNGGAANARAPGNATSYGSESACESANLTSATNFTFTHTGGTIYLAMVGPVPGSGTAYGLTATAPKYQITLISRTPGPQCNSCCPNNSSAGGPSAAGGSDGGGAPKVSEAPIRFGDGEVKLDTSDWSASGFGANWGQTRSFSNSLAALGINNGNGTGVIVSQWPYLSQVYGDNSTIAAVVSGTNAGWFDLNGTTTYTARFYNPSKLVYNSTANEFVLTDSLGGQTHYYDFTSGIPAKQQGQFKSYIDPYGNVTQVPSSGGHNSSGQILSVTRTDGTTTGTFAYSYIASGTNAGLLQNVQLKHGSTVIRQVTYTYYDGTQSYGNAGDLMKATIQDGASTPNTLDVKYYRYYGASDSHGNQHTIKYVFNAQAYARLVTAFTDPTTHADSDVDPYADNYFEYDTSNRVTLERASGAGCSCSTSGQGTYTFGYHDNTTAYDPTLAGYSNPLAIWQHRTTEQFLDISSAVVFTRVVYTNSAGHEILSIFSDGTNYWPKFVSDM